MLYFVFHFVLLLEAFWVFHVLFLWILVVCSGNLDPQGMLPTFLYGPCQYLGLRFCKKIVFGACELQLKKSFVSESYSLWNI